MAIEHWPEYLQMARLLFGEEISGTSEIQITLADSKAGAARPVNGITRSITRPAKFWKTQRKNGEAFSEGASWLRPPYLAKNAT
jgi:hypothetical protein